jgi:hypothetical protein
MECAISGMRWPAILGVTGALMLPGCNDEETTTPVGVVEAPLFESDIQPMFERSCGPGNDACHSRVAFHADEEFGCRGWLSLESEPLGSIIYTGPKAGEATGCGDMTLYDRLLLDAWQCGDPSGHEDDPLIAYVAPCDPEGSYLYRKMTGGPLCRTASGKSFDPMPLGAAADPADVENLRRWIASGAPRQDQPGVECAP